MENFSENALKDFFKKWPKFYNAIFFLLGPAFLTGLTSRKFVKRLPSSSRVLHPGSGTKVLGPNCTNVDILDLPNVDVVADLCKLPFDDNSFDAATSEQVFEHLPRPWLAAAEMERVVKPGGLIHIATPFLFPWHPSPSDYSRWTIEGLQEMFPGCELVESGVLSGPWSMVSACGATFLATIFSFGSRTLQTILQFVLHIVLFPMKFLDVVFAHFPSADKCAACVFVVLRVKET